MQLYKRAAAKAGHDVSKLPIASHSHGFVGEDTEAAADKFFPSTQAVMNVIGRERGWGHYDRSSFDAARSPDGALYVGDPETVARKIINLRKHVGITRFFLHVPLGTMPHEDVMRAIELLGTEVARGCVKKLPAGKRRTRGTFNKLGTNMSIDKTLVKPLYLNKLIFFQKGSS